MNLIERQYMRKPGLCIICECTPVEGQKVIDTMRHFETARPTKLEGEKYICEGCGLAIGAVLGLITEDAYAQMKQDKDAAEATFQTMKEYFKDLAHTLLEEEWQNKKSSKALTSSSKKSPTKTKNS